MEQQEGRGQPGHSIGSNRSHRDNVSLHGYGEVKYPSEEDWGICVFWHRRLSELKALQWIRILGVEIEKDKENFISEIHGII